MNPSLFKKLTSVFTFGIFFAGPFAFGASPSPALLKAKQEAEAKGYIFFANHDDIVAGAKKEGKLRVISGLGPANFKPLSNAFNQKYSFVADIHIEEIRGTEALNKFLLEVKAEQAKEWDIAFIPPDFASQLTPYLKKHDVFGMANNGVLKIHPGMIHPGERNLSSVISSLYGIAYNRKLISEDKVPNNWEDFLKPEFKGRKFVLDIRPVPLAGLVPAWGLERTLDFARKLAAQEPVWGRSNSRIQSDIAAGENSLFLGSSFDSGKRLMSKDPTGNYIVKTIEPVPTRIIDDAGGILNTAGHPHAALLWLEFLASPQAQEILDKYEPLKASVFTPGSAVAQELRGKKLSAVDWEHSTKYQEYIEKIFVAYGLPKAEK